MANSRKDSKDEYCEQEKQFEAMACISTVTLIHMESEDIYMRKRW